MCLGAYCLRATILAALLASFPTWSADARTPVFAGYRDVPLTNGIHSRHVAGVRLIAVRAERLNYNAHDFSVYSFYAHDGSDAGSLLLAVPFFGGPETTEVESVNTENGADCVLRDVRLLDDGKQARLVIAQRDFGQSYADAAPVHFDVYRFEHNTDRLPGFPPYDFRFERRIEAKRPYCDVEQAFHDELGLRG